jgi:hypothetical protein
MQAERMQQLGCEVIAADLGPGGYEAKVPHISIDLNIPDFASVLGLNAYGLVTHGTPAGAQINGLHPWMGKFRNDLLPNVLIEPNRRPFACHPLQPPCPAEVYTKIDIGQGAFA